MACPTCDHTMQALVPQLFWCPRCGSIRANDNFAVPKLVERCREFREHLPAVENPPMDALLVEVGLAETWHRLGIAESINIPKDRK